MQKNATVTGRDGYLMRQALAYSIVAIEALPEMWQEWSNKEDMKLLLETLAKGMTEQFMLNARSHLEQRGLKHVNGRLVLRDGPDDPANLFNT
jgi:hypothetical protein